MELDKIWVEEGLTMYGFLVHNIDVLTVKRKENKMWTQGVGPHKTIVNLDKLVKVWSNYVNGKYWVYGDSEQHQVVLKVCDTAGEADTFVTDLYKELT